MTNGSLMKVVSIAECSPCNTFDLHYGIIGLENQFEWPFYIQGPQNLEIVLSLDKFVLLSLLRMLGNFVCFFSADFFFKNILLRIP